MAAAMSGKPLNAGALSAKMRSAMADVIRRQSEAGIDVISDGELGKIGFGGIAYYGRRLSGLSTRKLKPDEVQVAFRRFSAMFTLRIPSQSIFQLSFDLRSRFSLSHWDSMLLAACKDACVTTLYSEDMDSGTDYDGLTIVNPFG